MNITPVEAAIALLEELHARIEDDYDYDPDTGATATIEVADLLVWSEIVLAGLRKVAEETK